MMPPSPPIKKTQSVESSDGDDGELRKLAKALGTLERSASMMKQDQAEKEGTVESLVPWTVVGRLADGRRTVVSVAGIVSGAEKEKII